LRAPAVATAEHQQARGSYVLGVSAGFISFSRRSSSGIELVGLVTRLAGLGCEVGGEHVACRCDPAMGFFELVPARPEAGGPVLLPDGVDLVVRPH
jgi:hypothetical protein